MKGLIVAATAIELEACRKTGPQTEVDYRVTGIGVPETLCSLMHWLSRSEYRFVCQVGIAGAYKASVPITSVVEIVSDTFADLGYDDRGQIVPAAAAGWIARDLPLYSPDGWMHHEACFSRKEIPAVRGLTVNTVSGSASRIRSLLSVFDAEVETMETAALFRVCLDLNIPFASLRAISNRVEPRRRESWEMEAALNKLSFTFGELWRDPDICFFNS